MGHANRPDAAALLEPLLSPLFAVLRRPTHRLQRLSLRQVVELRSILNQHTLIVGQHAQLSDVRQGWKLAGVSGDSPMLLKALAQPTLQAGSVWVRFNVWAGDTNLDNTSVSALRLLECALTRRECPNGAADAWAAETTAGIGGWFRERSGAMRWFHIPLSHQHLPNEWQCPQHLNKAISAFQLMAQHALLLARTKTCPGQEVVRVSWSQESDNMGAVGDSKGAVAEAATFICADEPVLLLP